ncbi:EamA family transporter [Flexibacterium corallicola]|uniref:EamA family transporter n=1 Tax=Flexibacterium corallicola TaxID=3037259 RepID=UPI00286EDE08|nr:EamA family transporter [Pseudovibrio sp. M1P-2-3]
MNTKGMLICALAMLSWSTLIVVTKGILLAQNLDPWIFTVIQMAAGGIFLIMIGGRANGALASMRSGYTWLYGGLRVFSACSYSAALLYVSAANAGFFTFLAIPFSAIATALLFSRWPTRGELPGHLSIVLGTAALIAALDGTYSNPAVYLMVASELGVALATIVAELHPSNQSNTPRQTASLSGVMLLSSATVMLVMLTLASLYTGDTNPQDIMSASSLQESFLPRLELAHIWNPHMWLFATLVGLTFRGMSMYFSLQAISLVGGQNYLATAAILPFMSLILESMGHTLGWMPESTTTNMAVVAGAVMAIGSLMLLFSRRHIGKVAKT